MTNLVTRKSNIAGRGKKLSAIIPLGTRFTAYKRVGPGHSARYYELFSETQKRTEGSDRRQTEDRRASDYREYNTTKHQDSKIIKPVWIREIKYNLKNSHLSDLIDKNFDFGYSRSARSINFEQNGIQYTVRAVGKEFVAVLSDSKTKYWLKLDPHLKVVSWASTKRGTPTEHKRAHQLQPSYFKKRRQTPRPDLIVIGPEKK